MPNAWVQFQINDAYVPEPVQILIELHGKDLLVGQVIDMRRVVDLPADDALGVRVRGSQRERTAERRGTQNSHDDLRILV